MLLTRKYPYFFLNYKYEIIFIKFTIIIYEIYVGYY